MVVRERDWGGHSYDGDNENAIFSLYRSASLDNLNDSYWRLCNPVSTARACQRQFAHRYFKIRQKYIQVHRQPVSIAFAFTTPRVSSYSARDLKREANHSLPLMHFPRQLSRMSTAMSTSSARIFKLGTRRTASFPAVSTNSPRSRAIRTSSLG